MLTGHLPLVAQVHAAVGLTFSTSDLSDPAAEAWPERTRLVWVETPSNPRCRSSTSPRARVAHDPRRDARGRQHVRDAVSATAADVGAMSWCTRAPSTSGDIRRVGGFVHSTIPRWPSGSGSCRTRPVRCPGRSTAISSSGREDMAVRMDRHAQRGRSRRVPRRPSRSRRGVLPGLAAIPATRWRHSRCARSVGWCRSATRARISGRRDRGPHARLHAGRVPGRGGVAHRAPRSNDPRVSGGFPVGGGRALVRLSVASRPSTTSCRPHTGLVGHVAAARSDRPSELQIRCRSLSWGGTMRAARALVGHRVDRRS